MGDMADYYLDLAFDYELGPDFDGEEYLGPPEREERSPCPLRICTKCSEEFNSRYAMACPNCGGWTDIK